MKTDISQSPLASALGIVLDQDNAKSDAEKKRAIAAAQTDEERANTDAIVARETLYEMIQKNNTAIDNLMDVARESMHPRAYEVLGALMANQAKNAELLLKVQSDKQKVQNNAINLERNKSNGALPAPGGAPTVHIENAVFTGTTTELLDLIKTAHPIAIQDQSVDINEDE